MAKAAGKLPDGFAWSTPATESIVPPDPAPLSHTAADGLSIRTRILLLLLAVLVPAAGVLAWLLAADLRQAREAAYARVRILANSTAAGIEDTLQRAEATLARLARHPALLTLDAQRCDAVAADFAELIPAYLSLTASDLQGQLVCSHGGGSAPDPSLPWISPSIAAAPHVQGFRISDVLRPNASARPIVILSQPLADAGGRPIGRLSVAVDLLSLNGQLLRATPPEALVSVVDRKGTVVLRSVRPESFIGTRTPGVGLSVEATPANGTFDATGRDGVPRIFAAASLPSPQWRVFAGLPQSDVFAPYREAMWRTTLIASGATLLALALAAALSAAIARPIARLRHSVLRVAAGDTTARAETAGPPEVRQLAQSFNHMLDQRALAEARLTGIFESALDAIITADETQHIVHANAAAARLLGCALESIVGSPLERFIPQAARAGHAAAVRTFGAGDLAARHMGRRRDVNAQRADGTEFPVEATISHLAQGGTRLYTVMLRDVTAARQAEKELGDSEALVRRLLMNLPEAVFVNTGNRISFVNQSAQRLFGGDESALLGRPPLELISEPSQAKVRERIAALTPEQPIAPLTDVEIVRLDGGKLCVESLGTLVEHNGERSIIVVLRDVSELRRAQAELEVSHADLRRLVAALERAQDVERRRISRELHDDLQQTLAAIRMDASMLRDGTPGSADAAVAALRIDELAAAAITSTRRLISDLRPQALDELGLLQALQTMARGFAQRTGTRCDVLASGAIAGIEPDPEVAMCLYRVAQEALNNVAKHSGASHARITLGREKDRRWSLSVQDDGQGMDTNERRKTHSFGLLGMRERVRALGGELRIDSEPGRGTSVWVWVASPTEAFVTQP
jgi:PAS domain S-box-containing protein